MEEISLFSHEKRQILFYSILSFSVLYDCEAALDEGEMSVVLLHFLILRLILAQTHQAECSIALLVQLLLLSLGKKFQIANMWLPDNHERS